jgi:DNA repair protein RecO (recombination protein O)
MIVYTTDPHTPHPRQALTFNHTPTDHRPKMEWDAPAIVLDARPYGETDMIATVMTADHGLHKGLAKGGASRAQAALWQAGNFAQIRWTARLTDQLGAFRGEMIHPNAALVMDDPLALAMLSAVCATAEGALPEREPHPAVFAGLLRLIAHLPQGAEMMADLVRWEATLLMELGYGLDLGSCAATGATTGLTHVSPRTGRAVSREAAEPYKDKLLKLPGFLTGGNTATADDHKNGLRLTGHFLARDAFGHRHRPLPQARLMLYDRVAALAESDVPPGADNAG